MSKPFKLPRVLAATTTLAAGAALVAAGWLGAGLLHAGPLTPPAGPVAPTYKTLSEVEPRVAISPTSTPASATGLFRITQRGSYYLTGNITGVSGKNGIEIATSGVTIDLMGYSLVGVAGSLSGITSIGADLTDLTVRSGTVTGWGSDGVSLAPSGAVGFVISGVTASQNGGYGVAAGAGTTISQCTAFLNTNGIYVAAGSSVDGCCANQNTGNGIQAASGSRIANSGSNFNGNYGIIVSNGCTVTGSSAAGNTVHGIYITAACTVANCTAANNGGSGMTTGLACTISGCTAYGNALNGVIVQSGSLVDGCSSYGNFGTGITTSNGCTVRDCAVRTNALDGILSASQCLIVSNCCAGNGTAAAGGAGIHITGADNRIEGNMCTTATRGIDVDSTGNIINRNTCSGNTTNWDVVAGNVCLVVQSVAGGSAILGNTGGVAPGSTDPNANFTY